MKTLITGASRGIGASLVTHGRERGHDVTGTTRSGPGGVDVTNASDQARLAEQAGPLDLLVCNAGVYLDRGVTIETMDAQTMADTFAANVTGVALTVQAQLANLGSGSRIAIIASRMGSQALASGGGYAYRASKAAAINLGRNFALDLAPRGIAVGIYHPGWVRTDMGGSDADVGVEDSVRGLWDRFEALDLDRTGCFEAWDGQTLAF